MRWAPVPRFRRPATRSGRRQYPGGAWGRWYGDSHFSDASDRRGVFPGDRIPGPANDTSTDLTPIGWGIRAYDLGDARLSKPPKRSWVMSSLGETLPRSATIISRRRRRRTRAIRRSPNWTGAPGPRALAWARLILTQAVSLDEANPVCRAWQEGNGGPGCGSKLALTEHKTRENTPGNHVAPTVSFSDTVERRAELAMHHTTQNL